VVCGVTVAADSRAQRQTAIAQGNSLIKAINRGNSELLKLFVLLMLPVEGRKYATAWQRV
jgi:hypothetical protein